MSKSVEEPKRLLDLIDAELPAERSWISPHILPKRGTLLFGGLAKIGKSFLMLEFARALSTGANPYNCPTFKVAEPCKVLLIEQELGVYGLQMRVKQMFEKEDRSVFGERLWYQSKVPDLQLDSDVGRNVLWDAVETVRPNVLILDPIGFMHAADENSNSEIGAIFRTLERLKKDFQEDDLSVIMSHHFYKPPGDKRVETDPLDAYNFRGASKWKDAPDTLITVHRLENLNRPWEAWRARVRYTLRHGESPKDMFLRFNDEGNLRVTYEKQTGGKLSELTPTTVWRPEPRPEGKPGLEGRRRLARAQEPEAGVS